MMRLAVTALVVGAIAAGSAKLFRCSQSRIVRLATVAALVAGLVYAVWIFTSFRL